MIVLLISLIVLAVIAALCGMIRNRHLKAQIANGELKAMPKVKMVHDCGAEECDNDKDDCSDECPFHSMDMNIVYYDDEELDTYKGIGSSDYTSSQANEFRDILYSMKENDVSGWVHSLQLRGISLPDVVKDEVVMILGEAASKDGSSRKKLI